MELSFKMLIYFSPPSKPNYLSREMLNKYRHNNVSGGGGVSNGEKKQDARDRNRSSQQIEQRKKKMEGKGRTHLLNTSISCDMTALLILSQFPKKTKVQRVLNGTVNARSRIQSRNEGKTCILCTVVFFFFLT